MQIDTEPYTLKLQPELRRACQQQEQFMQSHRQGRTCLSIRKVASVAEAEMRGTVRQKRQREDLRQAGLYREQVVSGRVTITRYMF